MSVSWASLGVDAFSFGEHRGTGFAGPLVLPPERGWAATRSGPTWGRTYSVNLDARFLGELAPANHFGRHHLAELLRRAAHAFAALGQQLVADLGLAHDRVDHAVEL